jgi:hypothetical protein
MRSRPTRRSPEFPQIATRWARLRALSQFLEVPVASAWLQNPPIGPSNGDRSKTLPVGMSPGISAGVVAPDDETRAWSRFGDGEVLVWAADTPDYFMQYAELASVGDRVQWQLRTLDTVSRAGIIEAAQSRLVGQVELTEQTDAAATDIGLLAGTVASIGVVYYVEAPDPGLLFVRNVATTSYPDQLEDQDGRPCYARGMLVGLDLDGAAVGLVDI